MPINELIITVVIIAVVVFAILRQVMPQRVRRLPFVIFPLIAVYEACRSLPFPVPANQLTEVFVTIVAALVAGAVLAFSTRVYYKGDQLYLRGGWTALAAWIGLIVSRALIHLVFEGGFIYTSQSAWILWTAVAVAFGSRSLILCVKHPEIARALAGERGRRRRA